MWHNRVNFMARLLVHAGVFIGVFLSTATGQQFPGAGGITGGGIANSRIEHQNAALAILSGKVLMDDESPAPAGINIVRVCSGGIRRVVTRTDKKGQFNYQAGETDDLEPDAQSAIPRRARGDEVTDQCELRADAPGYSSTSIHLDRLPGSNAVTLVLHRLENTPAPAQSPTALKAPADARKAYERGLESLHKGKTADAKKDLEKAVAIYPQYANAWLDLAKLRLMGKEVDAARDAFEKAIEADDKLAEAHYQLGAILGSEKQWEGAAKQFEAAQSLDPAGYPQALFNEAVAYFNLKKFDVAEKDAREALKLDPMHSKPEVDRLLGLTLASKGDFAGALEELNIFLKYAPDGPDAVQTKGQIAQIEKLQVESKH